MAGSQNNLWGQHDLNRVCFGLGADMEHSVKELQQQHMAKEYNADLALSQAPYYADTYRLMPDNVLLPGDGDQVVPSSQRRSAFGGHQREPKPLPKLPDPEELMSDEAADSEVEFFTSDRRRLLPKATCRGGGGGGGRDSGQVNQAYQENSLRVGGARLGSVCFSWPSREDKVAGRGGRFAANSWSLAVQGDPSQQAAAAAVGDSFAGLPSPTDKPQVPPRIPIPPKPSYLSKTANPGEEDRPPKVPPRVPLVPPCPPRTPSPKSLPIYINGVMPATQSFAANPKYVSKALQRQQSERAPPAAHFSPCIVPILKDGRQASATHYILLPPGRPAHADRRERPLSEPSRSGHAWQKR